MEGEGMTRHCKQCKWSDPYREVGMQPDCPGLPDETEALPLIDIGGVHFHAEKAVLDLVDACTKEIQALRAERDALRVRVKELEEWAERASG